MLYNDIMFLEHIYSVIFQNLETRNNIYLKLKKKKVFKIINKKKSYNVCWIFWYNIHNYSI